MQNNKGFLLIEVMVAIALLAGGLIFVSRAFSNCLKAMAQVENYTIALYVAEERFFQLETEAQAASVDRLADYPGYSMSEDVQEIKELNLKQVNIAVNWKQPTRSGSFEIHGYIPIKTDEKKNS